MTTAWKQPDWLYIVQEKIKYIDLSKFPSHIGLSSKVIKPEDNKYLSAWALCVDIKLEIKLRDTGQWTSLVNPTGIYLYSEKNFEEIIYVEIERLLVHELKECFQIKEYRPQVDGSTKTVGPIIPFDPHDSKRAKIKFASYDKVDIYRHYPSWFALIKVGLSKWWKNTIATCRIKLANKWQKFTDSMIRFAFADVKALPDIKPQVEEVVKRSKPFDH